MNICFPFLRDLGITIVMLLYFLPLVRDLMTLQFSLWKWCFNLQCWAYWLKVKQLNIILRGFLVTNFIEACATSPVMVCFDHQPSQVTVTFIVLNVMLQYCVFEIHRGMMLSCSVSLYIKFYKTLHRSDRPFMFSTVSIQCFSC